MIKDRIRKSGDCLNPDSHDYRIFLIILYRGHAEKKKEENLTLSFPLLRGEGLVVAYVTMALPRPRCRGRGSQEGEGGAFFRHDPRKNREFLRVLCASVVK